MQLWRDAYIGEGDPPMVPLIRKSDTESLATAAPRQATIPG
jgi:hypothetical protein